MKKESIKLNKAIYVGATVLDLSQLNMCKFWYDFLKKECKEANLLYMDTDSFIFEVINQNIILKDKDQFDTSNFFKDSELYNNENKNKLGIMKDEYAENRIREHIGLKPKSYSIIAKNNNENKNTKKINKQSRSTFNDKGYYLSSEGRYIPPGFIDI